MALLAKYQSFRCQRAQRQKGSSRRRKTLNGVGITKETLHFQNLEVACIKAPKGLQGTSGVGINDEIITAME